MFLKNYIQSYIEIPLILGIGLCKSKSLKYQYFKQNINNSHIINIKNKLFSLNLDDEFIEFTINNNHIYLHKIDSNHTFLTLILHENNVIKSFRAKQLQEKFKADIHTTIKLFEELSNQSNQDNSEKSILLDQSPESHNNRKTQYSSKVEIEEEINAEEALAAINSLSKFVCRYLGPKITSNFLNITQPKDKWIRNFEIKYSAVVIYQGDPTEIIKPLKILLLRHWTQDFMKQCYQLVRDLPDKFEQENLSEKHRKIISIYTSDYLNLENSSNYHQSEGLFSNLAFNNQTLDTTS